MSAETTSMTNGFNHKISELPLGSNLLNLPIPVIMLNDSGKIIYANKALFDLIEMKPSELSNIDFIEIIHPNDQDFFQERFKHFYKKPAGNSLELRLKNNIVVQLNASHFDSEPLNRGEQNPFLLVVVNNLREFKKIKTDLRPKAEQKNKDQKLSTELSNMKKDQLRQELQILQARKELQESETLYREIFESSKDGYMTLEGPDWKFTSANQAVLDQFKLKNEEQFLKLTPWQLSPPQQPDGRSSKEKAKEMIKRAVEEGHNYFEWTHQRSNGEDFFATVLLNRIDLEDRSFVLAIVRDITEQKVSRLQLEESENRYRSLFEKSTDPNLVIENMKFVDCNSATLEFMGYKSKSEIIGKSPWKISPQIQPDGKDSQQKAEEVIEKASRKGYARFEWVHLDAQNKQVWVDVALTFITLKGKDLIYTVWRDITKRKEAEAALEENRKRLELTLAGANIGLWDMDFTSGHIYRSKEWFSMLGYDKDKVAPTIDFWLELIHPDDKNTIISADEVANNSSLVNFENEQRLKCKDGTYKWVYNWGQVVERDKNGKALRAVGVHMDINERKAAEIALGKSEQLNRTVIEASPTGVSVRDTNGTLLLYNNAWKKLWDLTDAEIEAYMKPKKKLLFNEKDGYLGKNTQEIKRVYTQGGSYEIPELKLKKPRKGKAEWISQFFYAIKNEAEQVDRVVILSYDITQRKKAQLEIIKYRDHLEDLVKERTAELENKNKELKNYNKLFVGREFRIKELKNKVAELEDKLKDID